MKKIRHLIANKGLYEHSFQVWFHITVGDNFIEKIAKMGVMETACSLTEAKENKLAKKTDGSKQNL